MISTNNIVDENILWLGLQRWWSNPFNTLKAIIEECFNTFIFVVEELIQLKKHGLYLLSFAIAQLILHVTDVIILSLLKTKIIFFK